MEKINLDNTRYVVKVRDYATASEIANALLYYAHSGMVKGVSFALGAKYQRVNDFEEKYVAVIHSEDPSVEALVHVKYFTGDEFAQEQISSDNYPVEKRYVDKMSLAIVIANEKCLEISKNVYGGEQQPELFKHQPDGQPHYISGEINNKEVIRVYFTVEDDISNEEE